MSQKTEERNRYHLQVVDQRRLGHIRLPSLSQDIEVWAAARARSTVAIVFTSHILMIRRDGGSRETIGGVPALQSVVQMS